MIKILIKASNVVLSLVLLLVILTIILLPTLFEEVKNDSLYSVLEIIIRTLLIFILSVVATIIIAKHFYPRNIRFDIYIAIFIVSFLFGSILEYVKYILNKKDEFDISLLVTDFAGAILALIFCYNYLIPNFRKAIKKQKNK